MNQISWRHHFIPQFYLKGFTSKNGTFKIYDIQNKKFIKGGKEFYPESYFFEKDGNLIVADDNKYDFIEDAYKKIDNDIAEIFHRINNSSSKEKYNLNKNDIALLEYFVGIMYWRIPSNYNEIKNIINRKRIRELGLILKNSNNETIDDIELENKLKSDTNFFKSMKWWFASISYPETFKCEKPLHILTFSERLPSVCSDNPIISLNPDTFRVYSDDFIFPINSKEIFIRGEKRKEFMNTVKFEIDLLIYKQSKKYVSCTDEKYLSDLDKLFNMDYKNVYNLRLSIFKQLINYAT
jgi:hypothetical protein